MTSLGLFINSGAGECPAYRWGGWLVTGFSWGPTGSQRGPPVRAQVKLCVGGSSPRPWGSSGRQRGGASDFMEGSDPRHHVTGAHSTLEARCMPLGSLCRVLCFHMALISRAELSGIPTHSCGLKRASPLPRNLCIF